MDGRQGDRWGEKNGRRLQQWQGVKEQQQSRQENCENKGITKN